MIAGQPDNRFTHRFRPDVEGLRAVAILLVVGYHAEIPGFSGGYIGVDIFFVLSGYLITWLLVDEIAQTGRINLVRFYARRARRLLPAVMLMTVVVALAGIAMLSPLEQKQLAGTVIATLAYVSNIYFSQVGVDYFGTTLDSMPLLHTWSLAVEEQFYFVWPLLMIWGAGRIKGGRGLESRRMAVTMALVVGATFAASIWATGFQQPYAFFLSPFRAWEFALGGMGALGMGWLPQIRGVKDPAMRRSFGWLGMIFIVAVTLLYDDRTLFPGWAAAIPALATLLILKAGETNRLGLIPRVLAMPPLQAIGRLSYSWYLWHWPVLVFAFLLFGQMSLNERIILLAGSFAIAVASYRYIENPIRRATSLRLSPVRSLRLALVLTVGGISAGLWWRNTADATMASPPFDQLGLAHADLFGYECLTNLTEVEVKACVFGDRTSSETLVLFGDSHAFQWLPAVQTLAQERGLSVRVIAKAGCPVVQTDFYSPHVGRPFRECSVWREAALAKIDSIQPRVVIVSNWSFYVKHNFISAEEWKEGLSATFKRLLKSSENIFYLRDTPYPGFAVPQCLSRPSWTREWLPNNDCTFLRSEALSEAANNSEIEAAATFENVSLVDMTDLICPASICNGVRDSLVIYMDGDHMAPRFAASLAKDLARRMPAAFAQVER